MRTLIGGVGYRWQRDGSVGLAASDALGRLEWPAGVEVADLGFGAIYVAQELADARPSYDRLILLAGVARGRAAGAVHRYRYQQPLPEAEEILGRVREAGGGVIDLDHLLIIAQHAGALPPEVVVFEIEPIDESPGVELSPAMMQLLPALLEQVRAEALGETPHEEQGS
jgi:hydrogenase maturation protease